VPACRTGSTSERYVGSLCGLRPQIHAALRLAAVYPLFRGALEGIDGLGKTMNELSSSLTRLNGTVERLKGSLEHPEGTQENLDELAKGLNALVGPVEAIVERIDHIVSVGETVMSPLSATEHAVRGATDRLRTGRRARSLSPVDGVEDVQRVLERHGSDPVTTRE
jgi:ABC-type transporter Mla subunit MlaD